MISVVIATYNRPSQLIDCIESINKSAFKDFEIIVVDQSDRALNQSAFGTQFSGKVRLFELKPPSKSSALNFAIKKALGEIVCLTDDDCIVDKNWLSNINSIFEENKETQAIFGRVVPYRPSFHKGMVCPSTFESTKKRLLSRPVYHKSYIGFGNNVSFRKVVFAKYGGFKKWLGPSAPGMAAEDAEFSLRLLTQGVKIQYDPTVKVWHNRWISKNEMQKLMLSYICGEMACYGYYFLCGHKFAKKILVNRIGNFFSKVILNIQRYLHLNINKGVIRETLYLILTTFYFLRGLSVAFYYSTIDKNKN